MKCEEIIVKLKGIVAETRKHGVLPSDKRREIIEGLSVLAREDIPLYLLIELRQIQLKFGVWSRLKPVERGALLKRLLSLVSKLEAYFRKRNKGVPAESEFIARFLEWRKRFLEEALSVAKGGKYLWKIPVKYVKGVGPKKARALSEKLGVETVWDLIHLVPNRFESRIPVQRITPQMNGRFVTVEGVIVKLRRVPIRGGKVLHTLTLRVEDVYVDVEVWGSQFWLKQVGKGKRLRVSGVLEWNFKGARLVGVNPQRVKVVDEKMAGLGKEGDVLEFSDYPLEPVYPKPSEVRSQKTMQKIVRNALYSYISQAEDLLPSSIRGMLAEPHSYREYLMMLHYPKDEDEWEMARKAVALREIFAIQVVLAWQRMAIKSRRGFAFEIRPEWEEEFLSSLPFELTGDQLRVWGEIKSDMQKPVPMNRLLQGDVGSGKTVVAAMAAFIAAKNGGQVAILVPTSVLAGQHYQVFKRYLEPLGISVHLLLGAMSQREKDTVRMMIRSGMAQVVVGTHALIQQQVEFRDLRFVVIDEQHKFGVIQRAMLLDKAREVFPDVLVMTATPIPRTIVMTAYGDLDISIIKEMPPGRAGVTTIWRRSSYRPEVYAEVRKQLQQGRQAFVVVPFIEESEYEALKDVVSLEQAVKWAEQYFSGFSIGVLHGRMPEKDKQEIMEKFRLGEYQVLVSTPVIEVGIDVPNATAMIIESADYFGLSQLHQLRGRIGRGSLPGYCYLIADPKTEEARRRLEILVRYTDGFKIAEEDLKIRGPGELLGTRQHGYWGMRVANLLKDQDLLEPARQLAFEFAGRTSPGASRESAYLWDYLNKVFGEDRMNLIVVG